MKIARIAIDATNNKPPKVAIVPTAMNTIESKSSTASVSCMLTTEMSRVAPIVEVVMTGVFCDVDPLKKVVPLTVAVLWDIEVGAFVRDVRVILTVETTEDGAIVEEVVTFVVLLASAIVSVVVLVVVVVVVDVFGEMGVLIVTVSEMILLEVTDALVGVVLGVTVILELVVELDVPVVTILEVVLAKKRVVVVVDVVLVMLAVVVVVVVLVVRLVAIPVLVVAVVARVVLVVVPVTVLVSVLAVVEVGMRTHRNDVVGLVPVCEQT